jgi:hypothetical protein
VARDRERVGRVGAHEDDPATFVQVLVPLAGDEELAARVDGEDPVELLLLIPDIGVRECSGGTACILPP